MGRYRYYYFYIFVIACLFLFLISCSPFVKETVSPEEALKKRVEMYWNTLITNEAENAFAFIEPKAQNIQNRLRFVGGMNNFIFLSYEIEDIEVVNDRGSARVKRTFKMQPGLFPIDLKPISQTLTDPWTCIDGIWYLAYQELKLPFSQGRKIQKSDESRIHS
jgi:hypothetical protein